MEYIEFLSGLALLIVSGKFLVDGGVSFARHFKIPTLVIGVTVVAFGTSAPELIVSVNAAITGNPEIAFGNIVGSNISNIGLVLGATAVLIPIPVNRISFRVDWPVMMFASILLYVFILNDLIGFWEGLTLFIILISYLLFTVNRSRKQKKEVANDNEKPKFKLLLSIAIIILSSVGLAFGADFFVDGASTIAESWGVSKRVISITIVAFGTSAPELTASIIAALNKETDISIGNIIGSNIFNIMAVLGITSMVHEIPVDHIAFSFDIIFMLLVSILLFLFIFPFKTIYLNRVEGIFLVLSYIIYIALVFGGFDFESFTQATANMF